MFTRKQAWRRQRSSRSSERTIRFEALVLNESLNRSTSLPTFSTKPLEYSAPRHHTMDNLAGGRDKVVKFSNQIKVVLIPCRGEYEKRGLQRDIWWDAEDYAFFKASARLEVMDMLDKYKGNVRSALSALYQPDTLDQKQLSKPSASEDESSVGQVATALDGLRVCTELESGDETGETDDEQALGDSPTPEAQTSSIRPRDLFPNEPPAGSRVARDSLRKPVSSPSPSSSYSSPSGGPKVVHPLALMMS